MTSTLSQIDETMADLDERASRLPEEAQKRVDAMRASVEEGLAAAIGAGVSVEDKKASAVVDIGGGTTNVAVVARGSIVYSQAERVGSYDIDVAIMDRLRRHHGLIIGAPTAERWSRHVSLDGRFSVELPATPERHEEPQVTGAAITPVRFLVLDQRNAGILQATSYELMADVDPIAVQANKYLPEETKRWEYSECEKGSVTAKSIWFSR